LAKYPQFEANAADLPAEAEMAMLQEIVRSARSTRADNNVDLKQTVAGTLYAQNGAYHVANTNAEAIARLAKVNLELKQEAYPGVEAEFVLKLQLRVDRDRLLKEIAELEKVITNSKRQLSNEAFLAKAPPNVVAGMRQKLTEYEAQLAKKRAEL